MKSHPKVAIVYHYLAHYRLSIFKELMNSEVNDYTIISDSVTVDGIKGIDTSLANTSIHNGGLNGYFYKTNGLKISICGKRVF